MFLRATPSGAAAFLFSRWRRRCFFLPQDSCMDATDVETGASGGTPAAVAEAPQPDVVTSAPAVDDDVTKPQQAVGSNDAYTVL